MAVHVGYIDVPAIPADASTQTFSWGGLPWQPQAAKFWGASSEPGHTGETFFNQLQCLSIGFATDTGTNLCVTEGCRVDTTIRSFQDAGCKGYEDQIYVGMHDAAGESQPDLLLSIAAWNCNGWTFTVQPVTSSKPSFRLYYMAFSGVTLQRASGAVTLPASGAGVSVTGLGFTPEIIYFGMSTVNGRQKFHESGVATPTFQGFETFYAYEFGVYPPPSNGGGYGNGTGTISVQGGNTVTSFDADGFTLAGTPFVDARFHYLALADADTAAGFWAGHAAWPTTSQTFTPGFQAQAITGQHSGGNNGDRYGRTGFGAVDSSANAGAIFGQTWTSNVADPTGFFSTGDQHCGEANLTNSSLAILWDEADSTLATQNVTSITGTQFTLSGSTLPDANPQDLLLTAVACSSPVKCTGRPQIIRYH